MPQSGSVSSPLFSQVLLLRSTMAPSSFHFTPESWTAITTSGRPVVVFQARSMEAPVTPNNSCGLLTTCGSQFSWNMPSSSHEFFELYFQASPPRSPGGYCAGSSASVINMYSWYEYGAAQLNQREN